MRQAPSQSGVIRAPNSISFFQYLKVFSQVVLKKANLPTFPYLLAHLSFITCSYNTCPPILSCNTLPFKEKSHRALVPGGIFLIAGGVWQRIQPVRKILFRLHWKLPRTFPPSSYSAIDWNFLHLRGDVTWIPKSEFTRSSFTVHSKFEQ